MSGLSDLSKSEGERVSGRTRGSQSPLVERATLVLLAVLALLLAAQKRPLQGVHWDVPIYLYQAKRFAETHYLVNYARHAAEVAAQVLPGRLPADEWYSEAYWHFARMGNTVILGVIVGLFGSTLVSIRLATLLYTSLLMGGMALCLASVVTLGRTTEQARPWFAGAAISTLLFLFSDVYRYLAGNLVGEVPSLFLLGASVLALLHSVNSKRLLFAVLSGLLAFLSYTVRIESVWTWLTILFAYFVTRGGGGVDSVPWKPLVTAGLTALLLYAAYAGVFYPLADPRYFMAFALGQTKGPSIGVPSYKLLFVAGGLLWVGALWSLAWLRQSGLVRLGWLWLALAGLPWVPQTLLGGPCQTRMLTLLIPPLFLLSSAGWALLLERQRVRSGTVVGGISLCLIAISLPAVYAWLHNIPGGWRIQYARPFLFVPTYERVNYLPEEMAPLSRAIYGTDEPTVLVSGPAVRQENLNLIRFFGPSYPADSDLALVADPTNRKTCGGKSAVYGEPVLFCVGYADPSALHIARTRYRLLVLQQTGTPPVAGTTLSLRTPHFSLDEFQR